MVVLLLPGWKTCVRMDSKFLDFPFFHVCFVLLTTLGWNVRLLSLHLLSHLMENSCRWIRYWIIDLFLDLRIYKRWFLWILLYFWCQICFRIDPKVSFMMLVFVGWLSWKFFIDGVLLVEVILLNCLDFLWGISWFPINYCEIELSNKLDFYVPEGDMLWLVLTKCVHLVDLCIRHWHLIPTVPCDLLPYHQTHKAITALSVTTWSYKNSTLSYLSRYSRLSHFHAPESTTYTEIVEDSRNPSFLRSKQLLGSLWLIPLIWSESNSTSCKCWEWYGLS